MLDTLIEASSPIDNKITYKVNGYQLGENNVYLRVGQSYKVQLAFQSDGVIGYFSTVGVVKITTKPEIEVIDDGNEQMYKGIVYNNKPEYIGHYIQSEGGDTSEKVYSSEFKVSDMAGNVIADSGEVMHDVQSNPNSYESYDTFSFNRDLDYGKVYQL